MIASFAHTMYVYVTWMMKVLVLRARLRLHALKSGIASALKGDYLVCSMGCTPFFR